MRTFNILLIVCILYSMQASAQSGYINISETTVETQNGKTSGFEFVVKETSCCDIEQYITNEINPNDLTSLLKKKGNKASIQKFTNGVRISNAVIPKISSKPMTINIKLTQQENDVAVKLHYAHSDTTITSRTFPNEYKAAMEYSRQVGVKANKEVVGKQLSYNETVLKNLLKEREKTTELISRVEKQIATCNNNLKNFEYEKQTEQQFIEKQTTSVIDLKRRLKAMVKNSPESKSFKTQVKTEEKRLKRGKSNLSNLQNSIASEKKKISKLEQEKEDNKKYLNDLVDPKQQEDITAKIKEKLDNIK